MDIPPSGAAAAPQPEAFTIADSPTQANVHMLEVDPSALITPIKPNEQQLRAKKKQLQLQLAIVNNDSSTTVKKPAKKAEAAAVAAGKPLKWPPVSSAKSLPPLAGRMADLTKSGKRNTIEFEVNQECKLL